MSKNILITPSPSENPRIDFTGASTGSIHLEILENGTVAYMGDNGMLFSIVDDASGSLMSVNNISGLPIFEVFSTDQVDVNGYLQVDGSGRIDYLTLLNQPVDASHAANKYYVDQVESSLGDYVLKTGDTMTGDLSIDTSLNVSGKVVIGVAVGIKEPNPIATLDVSGNVNIDGSLYVDNSIYIMGNVGINTDSPAAPFQINFSSANLQIVGTAGGFSGYPYILPTTGSLYLGQTQTMSNVYPAADLGSNLGLSTRRWTTFYSDNITDDGSNVGIGTLDPSSKLHINGGVGSLSTGLTFGDGDSGIYESVDDTLVFNVASTEMMRLTSAGYLGIGTQNPAGLLHVEQSPTLGTEETSTPLTIGGGWAYDAGVEYTYTTLGSTSYLSEINFLTPGTSYTLNYEVITNPNSTQLRGDNAGYIPYSVILPSTVGTHSYNTAAATDDFYLRVNAGQPSGLVLKNISVKETIGGVSNILVVTNDGKVGIGRSDPQYVLDVSGQIGVNFNKIVNLGTPTDSSDATNKYYVDLVETSLGNYVQKTGDTMTGDLTMSDASIITNKILIPATGVSTGIWFGDGNTGIFENIDNELYISIAGAVNAYQITATKIRTSNNSSFGFLRANASSTAPTILPMTADDDTGIGHAGNYNDNILSLIAGGVEGIRIDSSTVGYSKIRLNPNGAVGASTGLWFGDGDTGIYESSDDVLKLRFIGTDRVLFGTNYIGSILDSWTLLYNQAASSTVPTIIPSNTDFNTGLGRAGADQLSLIAGGVEGMRITDSSIDALNHRIINLGYPIDASDATNKYYVDLIESSLGDYVQKTGDTMTGDLILSADASLVFSNGDTYISELSNDNLITVVGGNKLLDLTATTFGLGYSTVASGFMIQQSGNSFIFNNTGGLYGFTITTNANRITSSGAAVRPWYFADTDGDWMTVPGQGSVIAMYRDLSVNGNIEAEDITLGGINIDDILISSDTLTTSDTVLVTSGLVKSYTDGSLNQKLDNTTDTFTGVLTIDGSLVIYGDLYQDGSVFTINSTNIDVSNNFITLRVGAATALPDGSVSGIRITIPNGTDDVIFGAGNDAMMRVGWEPSTLQIIATREDSPGDNEYAYWDDSSTMFKTRTLDSSFGLYVLKAGDTMSGDLTIDTSLLVSGNVDIDNMLTVGDMTLEKLVPTIGEFIFPKNNTFRFKEDADYDVQFLMVGSDYASDPGRIVFRYGLGGTRFEYADGASNAEMMRITSDGSVGIGRSDPQYVLDVSGQIGVNNNKIVNLGTPTDSSDATNKYYVDTYNTIQDVSIAAVEASLNNTFDLTSYVNSSSYYDGSLNNIRSTYIPDVSLSTDFFWNSGSLEVSTGFATQTYVNDQNLWTEANNIITPKDASHNIELSSIEIEADAGAVTFVNMDVSSAAVDTEESYALQINNTNVARVYGNSDGSAGTNETAFIIDGSYFSMGDPNTNGSWRFVIDSSGDLSVQKRESGSWIQKGNFN